LQEFKKAMNPKAVQIKTNDLIVFSIVMFCWFK